MKMRRVAITAGLSLSVIAVGIASAAAGAYGSASGDPASGRGLMTACAAMHDTPAMEATHNTPAMEATHNTPAMERMHAAMPADAQAQCDEMHAMMDGATSGMMGATGTGSESMGVDHASGMMG
jgi:hypothetical protein